MMASTMTIPQVATLPNFHGPITGPLQGTMPGVQGGYPAQAPVTVHGPVLSGPVVNGNNSPTATLSPPIQAIRLPVVPVGGGCYNDGMEVVWHGEFSRLFSSFFPPHVWYLSITNSAPQEKWKFYRDSAKVRFCCQDCGNGWTSMKGRVTFWFHLNTATSEGFVQFKLYGQVCKKCNSGKFEYVMWYPEEVSKVMCNLYNKVGQTFYGFLQPPIRIDRRPGRPRNQHNADLCQACRDGECDQGRPVKAIYNYIPPPNARPPNAPPLPGRPPVFNGGPNQLPVVIRQPPIPHPGHIVMQAPLNSSTAPMPPGSHATSSFITAPVTLTSGVQPILTYSIVTAPVKDTSKVTSGSDGKETDTSKSATESCKSDTPESGSSPNVDQTPVPTSTSPQSGQSSESAIKSPSAVNEKMPDSRTVRPDHQEALAAQKSSNNKGSILPAAAVVPNPKVPTPKKPSVASSIPVPKTTLSHCRTVKEKPNVEEQTAAVNGYATAAGKPLPKVPIQPVGGVTAV